MRKAPVIDIVQIGAREHYAVPLMLHKLGLLRYLHTDVYAGRGSTLYPVAKVLSQINQSGFVKKILERQSRIPAKKIRANNLLGFRELVQLRGAKSVYEQTVIFHRFQRSLAEAAYKTATPAPDVFIGFRGSDRLFELAHENVCCILDQIDGALHEVEIIKNEQQRFPDWLPYSFSDIQKPISQPSWLDLERPRLQKEWDLADAIVCNSDWTRQCLAKCGVASEKCIVVPLAYEPNVTNNIKTRPTVRNKLKIAFLGTLTLRKGIHYLLEAAQIASEEIDITVLMAGSLDINKEKLRQYEGIAEYLGILPRGDVPAFFSKADILALPSISEGFGIVQLEAMSHGLPVVSSDRTGNIVRDGVDGKVVPAGDVEALANAFIGLARDPEAIRRMSLSAVERSGQFSFDIVAAKWLKAVHFALERQKNR